MWLALTVALLQETIEALAAAEEAPPPEGLCQRACDAMIGFLNWIIWVINEIFCCGGDRVFFPAFCIVACITFLALTLMRTLPTLTAVPPHPQAS